MVNSKTQNRSRVGVVAITLASHARGREFEPRIRYFSISFFFLRFSIFGIPKIEVIPTHNEKFQMILVIIASLFSGRTFSAVWLRSSVVSVLFSVKTENVPTGYIFFTCIFRLGRQ